MFCIKLARNPGYVLLSYRYHVETSMLVEAMSLLLLVTLSIIHLSTRDGLAV